MHEQDFIDSESENDPSHTLSLDHMLPPANPIISKHLQTINERVSIKIDTLSKPPEASTLSKYRSSNTEKQAVAVVMQKERDFKHSAKKNQQSGEHISLADEYESSNLLYQRYNNEKCNKRGNSRYIASIFINPQSSKNLKLPEYNGTIRDDQLEFDSNFESGNLLAVYKKGENNYDLLLQNDLNTNGFTQWYNFKVHNYRNNFIVQFNIVNFYKSQSLYGMGMKPCVCSEKSTRTSKIVWRRKGFNIFYQQNDLSYEDNANKCYKTLSFQYDFTSENDKVQFAHSMPYTVQNLRILLQAAKGSNKVSIKTIGTTVMGYPIPMVRIKSVQNVQTIQKKAIVILARQHPGETVGSFIAQEILLQMLKHSAEVEFLLWRFDIFIFPLVNLDGVSLGNYRSNFCGYDLNRSWQKTDPTKHPQVFAIKNEIKKIKKKQKIELILDLHGHSRKMGSFFYGNNFGTNPMLFPYIASKTNSNISFEDSKFSTEKSQKASTARVVLGNLIKQTGNVYTYEVSFFGNYKNDKSKTFSFNEEHYQQLGKALVLSMYRTYMEMYKEQKTLKESVYLKTIKKEIQIYKETVPQNNDGESGSDSQAQEAMIKQVKQLQEAHEAKKQLQIHNNEDNDDLPQQAVLIKPKEGKARKMSIEKKNDDIRHKISDLLDRSINSGEYLEVKSLVRPRLPSIQSRNISKQQQLQRQLKSLQSSSHLQSHKKSKNPHKLKVYGQTYELKSRMNREENEKKQQKSAYLVRQLNSFKKSIGMKKQLSKQHIKHPDQELSRSFNTIDAIQHNKHSSACYAYNEVRKIKYRNNSLQLGEVSPILFQQSMINEAVKVNKLNHSKIKEYNVNNSSFVLENAGRGLKLPQI